MPISSGTTRGLLADGSGSVGPKMNGDPATGAKSMSINEPKMGGEQLGGGRGAVSASFSDDGVANWKCCTAPGIGPSNPGGFRPGSTARGLLGLACPKTSVIASPRMSARGTKRLRALLDVRLRTDRSEASPWERSGSERPASDVCFRMSSSSMLSGSPKPLEAETLSMSVAPRGVQAGT